MPASEAGDEVLGKGADYFLPSGLLSSRCLSNVMQWDPTWVPNVGCRMLGLIFRLESAFATVATVSIYQGPLITPRVWHPCVAPTPGFASSVGKACGVPRS